MKKKSLRTIFLLGLFGVLAMSGCSSADQSFALPAGHGPYRTVEAEITDFPQSLSLVGYVESAKSETVKWKVNGVIESCAAASGDAVERGDILARLENDSLSPTVFEAEATKITADTAIDRMLISAAAKVKAYQEMIDKEKALADAKKFLEGLNYPVASASDLKSAEKAMIAARDAYEIAQADFEGVKLRAETDPERYQKKDALQKAMNAFFQANNVYVYYRDGVGEAAKAQARAAVLTAQAAYDAAVRAYEDFGDLSYNSNELTAKLKEADKATTVADRRSPTAAISGTISEMNCEAGTYVQANDILAKIDDLNTLYFRINASEFDLDKLKVGMETDIVLDANPGVSLTGSIAAIDATAKAAADSVPTYSVLIRIAKPAGGESVGNVYPSMTGAALIHLNNREGVLSIPIEALRTDEKGTYVEKLVNDEPRRIDVETGEFMAGRVELLGTSIQSGDRLVVPDVLPAGLSEP